MKKLLITASCIAASLCFVLTPVLAADMALKAPPPPPAPASNWTGFYIGGNIGYGWGNANNSINFAQSATLTGVAPFWTLGATDRNAINGVVGGGQIGYNWQVGQYLFGLETDFQGSGQQGSRSLGSALLPGAGLLIVTAVPTTITYTDRLAWLGTARGRVGYANGGWLFYGTGGLAYGEINASGNALPAPSILGPNTPFTWHQSATKVGWTAGAGVENAFASHWSWKVEYLYVDLGNATANVSGGVGNCLGPGPICNGPLPTPATGSATARFTDNIVRLGVNYRF
jgi:outer membrane immunogenic protein